ncbi:hypothetical protein TNCT_596331 [Trichonephila clavata]|uniref:Uncharacterized protein n=1 Tax=Trichonephila clavata TaxID=2740835 RepID=A0A8X6GAN1_TRICU|nr:hypothetical protein TNCT_596331 [Trichonephila clavata]
MNNWDELSENGLEYSDDNVDLLPDCVSPNEDSDSDCENSVKFKALKLSLLIESKIFLRSVSLIKVLYKVLLKSIDFCRRSNNHCLGPWLYDEYVILATKRFLNHTSKQEF